MANPIENPLFDPIIGPKLWLARQDLANRYGSDVPFITLGIEKGVGERFRPAVGHVTSSLIIGGLTLILACSPAKEATTTIVSNPNNPAAPTVPCEPDRYAESIGVPTPVPVGGGAAPAEIIVIGDKVRLCEPLSEDEKNALIKFNAEHPQLGTAPTLPERISQPSPVEQAIKEGKIEITQPQEWEKSYIAITPQEAEDLLADPNNKDKMLLPFDPTDSPNLVIKIFEWNTPTGNHRAFMGLENITPGLTFYAPHKGDAKLTRGALEKMLSAGWNVKAGNNTYSFILDRNSVKPLLPYDQLMPVELGTPLMTIISDPALLPFYDGGGVYQAVGGMGLNSSIITEISFRDLLSMSGRFAFISQKNR